MTLTTHAIVGAAAMSATVSALGATPAGLTLGFAAGFVSHFAIDAIPHWNEAAALLRTVVYDKDRPLETDLIVGEHKWRDLTVVSADGLLGLFLSVFVFSFWLFQMPFLAVCLGAAAGELPDALQFVYFKMRCRSMRPLQDFHMYIQKELTSFFSIGIEVMLVVVVVGVLRYFT